VLEIRKADKVRSDASLATARTEFDQKLRVYQDQLVRDERQFERWKRSWFCMSCAALVVERRDAMAATAGTGDS
jgi:hypothetical protein